MLHYNAVFVVFIGYVSVTQVIDGWSTIYFALILNECLTSHLKNDFVIIKYYPLAKTTSYPCFPLTVIPSVVDEYTTLELPCVSICH